eukprot:m.338352 g.338352  ORF g.338352 m.338352 type:complete len:501 (+) comp18391_c0_seq1:555-2057(+)
MPQTINLNAEPPADLDEDGKTLFKKLANFGQTHVLKYWNELSAEKKALLKVDIESVDLEQLNRWFLRTQDSPAVRSHRQLKPVPDELVADSTSLEPTEEMLSWEKRGFELISDNKLAVLLMAGGQGTRLGSSNPKGMFPLELLSGATLFELQAKRILKVQELASAQFDKPACVIVWYIMTSDGTHEGTESFFKENNYFGIKEENIVFFRQNEIPCLLADGKMVLIDKHKISRSPDGNGGLYSSMVTTGVLDDMIKRDIKYIHIYGVDNVLVKVGDPRFLGFCDTKQVEVGAKCVVKKEPTEKVGLICMNDKQYEVMEYSEITPEARESRRPDGALVFNAGNIVNHLYTIDFMKKACQKEDTLKHHVAHKKLPYVNDAGEVVKPSEENGIKLEKFVFDVFRLASSLAVVQVSREAEFSPLKNASAAKKDCKETCCADLYSLHRKYLLAAGAVFEDENGKELDPKDLNASHKCELSPAITYHGEGLEQLVKDNKRMKFPILL